MDKRIKYYKRIDIVRFISCIAVLLYHLKAIKGGFLAVCTFFVLTGYLSCISAYNKETFSIKEYYKSRFKRIYIPLLIVVCLSIVIFSIIPNNGWLSMKNESFSVLFGYNNFWQMKMNSNYFTKQLSTPFVHFWYIAILIQFDVIFPLAFVFFRKLERKTKKIIPTIIIGCLAIGFAIYFLIASYTYGIVEVYYNTFTRIFSILFGCLVANIQHNSLTLIFSKRNKQIFGIYLSILVIMLLTIDSTYPHISIIMVLITILSCRLIDYCTIKLSDNHMTELVDSKKISRIINGIIVITNKISYEIFLVQCPVIYVIQQLNISLLLSSIIGFIITIIISFLLYAVIYAKGREKKMSAFVKLFLAGVILAGNCILIASNDYSKEIKELEQQMEQNSILINSKNIEYIEKIKSEQEQWNVSINSTNDEEQVRNKLKELKVVGIGDSVMLGAVPALYELYPNGYFDAKVSRNIYAVNSIVENLKSQNKLGDVIIFNLGANGEGSKKSRDQVLNTIGTDIPVFWMTVTNDKNVHVNGSIRSYPEQYPNMQIIDWEGISNGHKDYFYADGLHLTATGRKAYANAVNDALYNFYYKKYQEKKEEMIRAHEEELKKTVSFFGNDVLVFLYDYLQEKIPNATFDINKEYTYEILKNELIKKKEENIVGHRIVLAFDNLVNFTEDDYNKIIELCSDNEIYIICMDKNTPNIENENVKIIDFYKDMIENDNYLLGDKIHLSADGNDALSKLIIETLKF